MEALKSKKSVKEILKSMDLSKKVLAIVNNLIPSYGSLIVRKDNNVDPIRGFLRLDNNMLVYIEGYFKQSYNNSVSIPLRGVVVPEEMLLDGSKDIISEVHLQKLLNNYQVKVEV